MDGARKIVARIGGLLERLGGAEDPVAERTGLLGRDAPDQEALGSQAGRAAS